MKALDVKLLQEFLRQAGDKLKGEWLLVGGTLLPAVGLNVRSTVDIDLVGLGTQEDAQSLAVMELTDGLGLSIETINQAAAFFVKKVGHKKSDLLPLHKGRNAEIFRPSVLLYWKLKLARLSEADVMDCLHYFNFCKGNGDIVDLTELRELLTRAEKSAGSAVDRRERIAQLRCF